MTSGEILKSLLFPYPKVRPVQEDLIKEVVYCLENKKNLIVHAPTGLGKTASTLPMAVAYAIKHNLTVFFLTSRHTQHKIAIETLQEIKNVYNKEIITADLIAKQHMCLIPGTQQLYSGEFSEFCRKYKEDDKCEFYINSRKKSGVATLKTIKTVEDIRIESPCSTERILQIGAEKKLCPYELSLEVGKKARVVIADYHYIFHPKIRENFLKKTEKRLADSIVIIDEAHDLPKRAIELLTQRLSSYVVEAAIKEAKKYEAEECETYLLTIKEVLENLANQIPQYEEEKTLTKDEFVDRIHENHDYDEVITALTFQGDQVLEKQKKSFMSTVAFFLEQWIGPDKSFARILTQKNTEKKSLVLSYKCLDPSLLTRDIIAQTHSTILMSGTLSPTSMYREILGFDKNTTIEKEFQSPFPPENKLALIIPETTTKFTMRSPEQFKAIAEITAKIINAVPGNTAVFFPSYSLRDEINKYLQPLSKKTLFYESRDMSKGEKEELLEKFKSYKDQGAALLGVAAGSFSQGVDFKGDMLKGVIVVGLPLQRPDLETKQLIAYYDEKFQKGWEYGYTFPAITKCLQSAGRCIRSETDRGILVFLDERFAWNNYMKYFPEDLNVRITKLYLERINEFFNQTE